MAEQRPANPSPPDGEIAANATEQLRAVLRTAMDAIITIDDRGEIRMANPAANRMFGYEQDELLGQNLRVLLPEPHRERHSEHIQRYRQTGESRVIGQTVEQVGLRKDGTEFPVELAVAEIEHLGLFTGIVRDVTERKAAAERLQQADRLAALGTLAAGLGHDMSNILLPLRSRLDVIEKAPDPEIRRQVSEIRQLVRYMQHLADGLHQLVSDPGHETGAAPPIGLREWWAHAGILLHRAIPGSVRFTVAIDEGLPPVRVARYRLTQAVFNLLINAKESFNGAGTGEGERRVELLAQRGPDQTVRLAVRDTGCGMEPEVLRRALEPFFTTKVRRLGTGLGLPIVHTMVRESGGRLEIDSRPGSGTSITLVFPAAAHAEQATEPSEPAVRRAVVTSSDPRGAAVVAALLETYGLTVSPGGDVPVEPADLWVTEPGPGVLEFLRRPGPRARVVLLGDPGAEWDGPECEIVRDPGDFGQLQSTLARALKGLHDEPAHDESALR